MTHCPSCKSEVKPRVENAAFPFCTERCRAVDLGRWFLGAYRVPGPPAPSDEQRPEPDEADEPER